MCSESPCLSASSLSLESHCARRMTRFRFAAVHIHAHNDFVQRPDEKNVLTVDVVVGVVEVVVVVGVVDVVLVDVVVGVVEVVLVDVVVGVVEVVLVEDVVLVL